MVTAGELEAEAGLELETGLEFGFVVVEWLLVLLGDVAVPVPVPAEGDGFECSIDSKAPG